MERKYLYVPFEEYEQLKKLGAHWDSQRKCWYLEANEDPAPFKRWLGDAAADGEEGFVIESDKAFVASAATDCCKCGANIEVVCIYCENGKVDNEPYREFTVSNITSVDEPLKEQLARWPFFRHGFNEELEAQGFANHCSKCNEVQGEFLLHCEPGGPFFTMKGAPPNSIKLTRLAGTVRMNGDEGFEP